MSKANLRLTIEHLVLPDLPPSQRLRVVEIVEQELGRLWAERGMPTAMVGESSTLGAARIEVAAGADAQAMGRQVAHAIYTKLTGQARSGPDSERKRS
jgi:hypothetical protein